MLFNFSPLFKGDILEPSSELARFLFETEEVFFLDKTTMTLSADSRFFSMNQNPLKMVTFSHKLLRTQTNQWHILSDIKGEGAFGTVYTSAFKIVITPGLLRYSAQIIPVTDVVKIQSALAKNDQDPLKLVQNEAQNIKKMGINVSAVIDLTYSDQIALVMEDCGVNLKQYLDSQTKMPFIERLYLALQVINECLLLQKKGIIHRDLKPTNFCYKTLTQKKRGKLKVVDFGLSVDERDNVVINRHGTPHYMAPEVYYKKRISYQSEIYSLAGILGEIFGSQYVISLKDKAYKGSGEDIRHCVDADYMFEQLFTDEDFALVDPCLLENIRKFLSKLASATYQDRPSIDVVSKFFTTIPARLAEYEQFQLKWQIMVQGLKDLERYSTQINSLGIHNFFYDKDFPVHFKNQMNELYRALALLSMPEDHYRRTLSALETQSLQDGDSYPDVSPIIKMIENQKKFCNEHLADLEETVDVKNRKYKAVNNLLFSTEPPIIQLKKLTKYYFERGMESLARDNRRAHTL